MFHKSVLPNGVRVLSETLPSHTVSIGIWVDVGSRDEIRENNGAAHFVEHMLFKGTPTRSASRIGREFDVLGGMSNGFTTRDTTCYYATVLADKLPVIIELLSDIFLNSLYQQEEILRERDVILQEINMVDDTPDDFVHETFSSQLWGDHPLGFTVLGSREVVAGMTSDKIKKFVKEMYTAERIVIAAAGDVEHNKFVDLVGQYFSNVTQHKNPVARIPPEPQAPVVKVLSKDLEQVHVVLGTHGPAATADERYVMHLLSTILGGNMSSRLFQEIREKRGLAYSVYSFVSSFIDSGYCGVYLGVDPGKAGESISLVRQELERIYLEPVLQEELVNAKDFVKASLLLSADNMESRMMRIARNELLFNSDVTLAEVADAIDGVRREEIAALAADIFTKQPLTLVAIGQLSQSDID